MSNEESNVLTVVETMTASLEVGDIDGVLATYEAGAAVMFEPGAAVSGREAFREVFSQIAAARPEVSYAGHEVHVVGDLAIHLAPWSMTGETSDGEAITQGGLSVAVLRRQPDGEWRLVIDNPYGDRLLNR